MAENPLIEILLATYNGEMYVEQQIRSLMEQTYKNIRVVVSDDGSTDGTIVIVKKLMKEDSRIVLNSFGHRKGGAKQNFFHLLKLARADFVMFCDQDDVWESQKVEYTLKEMIRGECRKCPRLVYTDMKVVDKHLRVINNSFLKSSNIPVGRYDLNSVCVQNIGAGCTMMVNRQLINYALRQFNMENVIMHDWWISLIAAAFGSVGFINLQTVQYRQHGNNSIGAVKYSAFKNAINYNRMIRRIDLAIRQTKEFAEVFHDELTEKQLSDLKNFYEIPNQTLVRRFFHICLLCRVWKKGGIKKIGQFISLMCLTKDGNHGLER